MYKRVERLPTLVLLGAVAALACACKGRSGSEPLGGIEHEKDVSGAGATTTAVPALWEPIDKNFKGCEGG
jgi:hypothetical protein